MKIIVTQKVMKEEIPVDTVLDAIDGASPKATLEMLSYLAYDDDGNKIVKEQARKELGKLTFKEIEELLGTLRKETEDILVPPPSDKG